MQEYRLIVTGDVTRCDMRPGVGWNQRGNVRMLRDIVSAAAIDSGFDVGFLTPEQIFGSDALNVSDRTAELITSNDTVREFVRSYVAGAIVVGFELPDTYFHLLGERAAAVIDVAFHPIRLLDDLFFAVRASGAHSVYFQDLAISKAALKSACRARKGYFGRREKQFFSGPDADVGVFAGQLSDDNALLCNGRYLSLSDFKSDLLAKAATHDLVVFCRHPLAGQADDRDLEQFLNLPNAYLERDNTYRILSYDDVTTVYSISSSILHEADAWGKKSVSFAPSAGNGFPLRENFIALNVAGFISGLRLCVESLFGAPKLYFQADYAAIGKLRDLAGISWNARIFYDWYSPGSSGLCSDFTYTPINQLNGAQFLFQGWNSPEEWGVWSRDTYSTIAFRLTVNNPAIGEEVTLRIRVLAAAPDGRKWQTFRIFTPGGQSQFNAVATDGEPMDILVRYVRNRMAPTEQVHFQVDDPVDEPSGRKIGLGLVGIQALPSHIV